MPSLTDPEITFHAQFGAIYKPFECFFNIPFTTVVGGRVDLVNPDVGLANPGPQVSPGSGFTTISWDGANRLTDVPGIEFSARTRAFPTEWASTPKFEQLRAAGVDGIQPTMLV